MSSNSEELREVLVRILREKRRVLESLDHELWDMVKKTLPEKMVYIPRYGSREEQDEFYRERNETIYRLWERGVSVKVLAESYLRSAVQIQGILTAMKKEKAVKVHDI